MAFRPASSPRRVKCCSPAAYAIANNNGYKSLTLRITRQLAYSAGITKGTPARFDLGTGSDAGLLRITPVTSSTRHWGGKGQSNQSLYLSCSWSGDLEAFFPYTAKMTSLEVVDISRTDGLVLKLATP